MGCGKAYPSGNGMAHGVNASMFAKDACFQCQAILLSGLTNDFAGQKIAPRPRWYGNRANVPPVCGRGNCFQRQGGGASAGAAERIVQNNQLFRWTNIWSHGSVGRTTSAQAAALLKRRASRRRKASPVMAQQISEPYARRICGRALRVQTARSQAQWACRP